MWSPQTIVPFKKDKYNSHFSAYGLGWRLTDVKGTQQVSHTGGLEGMVTQVTLLPEMKLGIVVLTNQESGAAFTAVTNAIKDSFLGMAPEDWVLRFDTLNAKSEKEDEELSAKIQAEIDKTLLEAGETTRCPFVCWRLCRQLAWQSYNLGQKWKTLVSILALATIARCDEFLQGKYICGEMG